MYEKEKNNFNKKRDLSDNKIWAFLIQAPFPPRIGHYANRVFIFMRPRVRSTTRHDVVKVLFTRVH